MKILALSLILLFASAAFPQTANVIELAPDDSARAKAAWDVLQTAQHNWDDLQEHMRVKYTTDGRNDKDRWPKAAFTYGFEFSKDFRFIVPKLATSGTLTYGNSWGGNYITPIMNCSNFGNGTICAN